MFIDTVCRIKRFLPPKGMKSVKVNILRDVERLFQLFGNLHSNFDQESEIRETIVATPFVINQYDVYCIHIYDPLPAILIHIFQKK